jgi:dihydroorotase
MNPPIRKKEHYDRLWAAVKNSIVDVLGSDHAPHSKEDKKKKYPKSPSGMPGVQTILPIMLNHINNKKLSLEQLMKLMCENPCKIFGIQRKGYIKEGFDADLTIVDMNKEQTIKNEMMATKCGWTPFNDMSIKGFPIATIINGKTVMLNGKVILEGFGQPLEF